MSVNGTLRLNVHTGTLLTDPQTIGKADLFLKMWTKDERFETKCHENAGKRPVWEQSFVFNVRRMDPSSLVHFVLINKNVISNDKVGRADITLGQLNSRRKTKLDFPLVSLSDFNKQVGKIEISSEFIGTGMTGEIKQAVPVAVPAAVPAAVPVIHTGITRSQVNREVNAAANQIQQQIEAKMQAQLAQVQLQAQQQAQQQLATATHRAEEKAAVQVASAQAQLDQITEAMAAANQNAAAQHSAQMEQMQQQLLAAQIALQGAQQEARDAREAQGRAQAEAQALSLAQAPLPTPAPVFQDVIIQQPAQPIIQQPIQPIMQPVIVQPPPIIQISLADEYFKHLSLITLTSLKTGKCVTITQSGNTHAAGGSRDVWCQFRVHRTATGTVKLQSLKNPSHYLALTNSGALTGLSQGGQWSEFNITDFPRHGNVFNLSSATTQGTVSFSSNGKAHPGHAYPQGCKESALSVNVLQ